MMRILLVIAMAAVLGGCQMIGGAYDRMFGARANAPKPAELPAITPTAQLRVVWQVSVGSADRFAFAPRIAGSAVYAAAAAGQLVKIDLASGRTEWRVQADTRLSTGPGSDGQLVVTGSPRGEVLAFDNDGKLLWKALLPSNVSSAPAFHDGLTIIRTGDGRIVALSAQDGRRLWVYQRALPALTVHSPAGLTVSRGGVFAGFPGGRLVALIADSGALAWDVAVSAPRGSTELERMADVVGAPRTEGREVCAVSFQGRAACFDLEKGAPLWARPFSSIEPIDMDGRYVFATDDKGHIHALDRASGASIWRQDQLTGRSVTGAVAIGAYVAVGDYQGYVHLLRREDGAFAARVATDGSAVLVPPLAIADGLIVQTRAGTVYRLAIQ